MGRSGGLAGACPDTVSSPETERMIMTVRFDELEVGDHFICDKHAAEGAKLYVKVDAGRFNVMRVRTLEDKTYRIYHKRLKRGMPDMRVHKILI